MCVMCDVCGREPVRVCEKCHQRINQLRTPFVSKFINSSETDPVGTPPTGNTWRESSNSLNIERNLETGGNRWAELIPILSYRHTPIPVF